MYQSFFLCVFCTQCLLERDHLWDCTKVVLKTTFEQSQRWSYYRNFTVIFFLNITNDHKSYPRFTSDYFA